MRMTSIYEDMNRTVEFIPVESNVKLLFRHSVRNLSLQSNNPKKGLLTDEGIELAIDFGKKIYGNLGFICSSNFNRCQQTLECILKGRNEKRRIAISKEILASAHVKNNYFCQLNIRNNGGLKKTVWKLNTGVCMKGIYDIKTSSDKILDLIFETGNKENTIDLYCCHDFLISMLLSYLFNFKDLDKIRSNWPNFLEGPIFWGTRYDFFCGWRDEIKHFMRQKDIIPQLL